MCEHRENFIVSFITPVVQVSYMNFKICFRPLVLLEMIAFEHRNLQYDVNNLDTKKFWWIPP